MTSLQCCKLRFSLFYNVVNSSWTLIPILIPDLKIFDIESASGPELKLWPSFSFLSRDNYLDDSL